MRLTDEEQQLILRRRQRRRRRLPEPGLNETMLRLEVQHDRDQKFYVYLLLRVPKVGEATPRAEWYLTGQLGAKTWAQVQEKFANAHLVTLRKMGVGPLITTTGTPLPDWYGQAAEDATWD